MNRYIKSSKTWLYGSTRTSGDDAGSLNKYSIIQNPIHSLSCGLKTLMCIVWARTNLGLDWYFFNSKLKSCIDDDHTVTMP